MRDRHVSSRETVAVQRAAELADRRVHRGDLDDVALRVVHLDPVPELVEAHRDKDDPSDQVQQRFLHDVQEGGGHERGPEERELARAAEPEQHVENEGDRCSPHDVRDDLEMGEDVRLVFHVGLEGGAEHRSQEFEEGLRRDEDRDRVDPGTEGAEIQMRRREPRDRDRAGQEAEGEEHDQRDDGPE